MPRRSSKNHSGSRSLVVSIPIKVSIQMANTSNDQLEHTTMENESNRCGKDVKTSHDVMKTPAQFRKKFKRDHSSEASDGLINKQLNTKKPVAGTRKDCFKCSKCAKKYTSKKGLLAHYRKCHSDLASRCSHRHRQLKHGPIKNFQCRDCGRQYVFKSGLIRHCRLKHDHHNTSIIPESSIQTEAQYYDIVTNNTASQTTVMSTDPVIVSTKSGSRRYYKCPLCGKIFTRLQNFRDHMNMHTGVCPYKCQHCDKSFPNYYYRHQHIAQEHMQ